MGLPRPPPARFPPARLPPAPPARIQALGAAEVAAFAREASSAPTNGDVAAVLAGLDFDGDGSICLADFIVFGARAKQVAAERSRWTAAAAIGSALRGLRATARLSGCVGAGAGAGSGAAPLVEGRERAASEAAPNDADPSPQSLVVAARLTRATTTASAFKLTRQATV